MTNNNFGRGSFQDLIDAFKIQIAEESWKKPMPEWVIEASAKLLTMSLPTIKVEEWREVIGSGSLLEAFDKVGRDGRLIGHFLRMLDDLETAAKISDDPLLREAMVSFDRTRWIESLKLEEGNVTIIEGTGAKEMAHDHLQKEAMTQGGLALVYRNVARAMEAKPGPREQDRRAWRLYLFMIIMWPTIEKFRGKSTRELYQWLFPILSWPEPRGEDEVDLKDQHYKWFEKICLQNLELHLKPKGRRVRKLERKPPAS